MARQYVAAAEILAAAPGEERFIYAHISLCRHSLELLLKSILARQENYATPAIAERELKKVAHSFNAMADRLEANEFFSKNEKFGALLPLARHYAETTQGAGFRYPYERQATETYSPRDITAGLSMVMMALVREARHAMELADFSLADIALFLDGPIKNPPSQT